MLCLTSYRPSLLGKKSTSVNSFSRASITCCSCFGSFAILKVGYELQGGVTPLSEVAAAAVAATAAALLLKSPSEGSTVSSAASDERRMGAELSGSLVAYDLAEAEVARLRFTMFSRSSTLCTSSVLEPKGATPVLTGEGVIVAKASAPLLGWSGSAPATGAELGRS